MYSVMIIKRLLNSIQNHRQGAGKYSIIELLKTSTHCFCFSTKINHAYITLKKRERKISPNHYDLQHFVVCSRFKIKQKQNLEYWSQT